MRNVLIRRCSPPASPKSVVRGNSTQSASHVHVVSASQQRHRQPRSAPNPRAAWRHGKDHNRETGKESAGAEATEASRNFRPVRNEDTLVSASLDKGSHPTVSLDALGPRPSPMSFTPSTARPGGRGKLRASNDTEVHSPKGDCQEMNRLGEEFNIPTAKGYDFTDECQERHTWDTPPVSSSAEGRNHTQIECRNASASIWGSRSTVRTNSCCAYVTNWPFRAKHSSRWTGKGAVSVNVVNPEPSMAIDAENDSKSRDVVSPERSALAPVRSVSDYRGATTSGGLSRRTKTPTAADSTHVSALSQRLQVAPARRRACTAPIRRTTARVSAVGDRAFSSTGGWAERIRPVCGNSLRSREKAVGTSYESGRRREARNTSDICFGQYRLLLD